MPDPNLVRYSGCPDNYHVPSMTLEQYTAGRKMEEPKTIGQKLFRMAQECWEKVNGVL